jgi:hypothetical protein
VVSFYPYSYRYSLSFQVENYRYVDKWWWWQSYHSW